MQSLRGPFNPSTNDMCGILTTGFEHPPRIMMPYNPAYYPALFEGVGLRPVRELLAYELDPPALLPEAVHRVAETAAGRGCRVRSLDPGRLGEEAEAFRLVYNAAWSENWGFVPMSQAEAAWMASQLREVLVPELALVAEWDGRPVGFFLCLPDVNPALRLLRGRLTPWGLCRFLLRRRRVDELRLILLGVDPEYRRRGVEALLLREGYGAVRRLGYRRVEVGWILEENTMTRQMTKRWEAREVKRYRIYQGPL
jgi:GNAT superfamily N-acetyltransferase